MSVSSPSTPAPEPRLVTLYVVKSGQTHRLDIEDPLSDEARVAADADIAADREFEAAGNEETAEEKTANDELLREITRVFHMSETQMRVLAEGDGLSKLAKQDVLIGELMSQKPDGLWLTRCAPEVNPDGMVSRDRWGALQLFDLNESKVREMFTPKLLADFKAMKPAVTKVRLLIIENVVCAGDVIGPIRFQIFYALHKNYAAAGLDVTDKQRLAVNARTDVPGDSIAFITVQWGFTLMQARHVGPIKGPRVDATEAARLEAQAKQNRFYAAHTKYLVKRAFVRRSALRRRMSVIVNYVILHYAEELVSLMDAAAPNIPDRLLIRIQTEDSGSVILLDETTTVRHRMIKKVIADLRTDMEPVEALAKKEPDNEDAQLGLLEYIKEITTLEDCEKMLAAIDPSTDVLLVVCDQGKWNDKGIPVQQSIKLSVPYARLRPHIAKMRAAAAAASPPAQETSSSSSSSDQAPAVAKEETK